MLNNFIGILAIILICPELLIKFTASEPLPSIEEEENEDLVLDKQRDVGSKFSDFNYLKDQHDKNNIQTNTENGVQTTSTVHSLFKSTVSTNHFKKYKRKATKQDEVVGEIPDKQLFTDSKNDVEHYTDLDDMSTTSTTLSEFPSLHNPELNSTKQQFIDSSNTENITELDATIMSRTQDSRNNLKMTDKDEPTGSTFTTADNQLNFTQKLSVKSTSSSITEVSSDTKISVGTENTATLASPMHKTDVQDGLSTTAGREMTVSTAITTVMPDFNKYHKINTKVFETTEMSTDKLYNKSVDSTFSEWEAMSSGDEDITLGMADKTTVSQIGNLFTSSQTTSGNTLVPIETEGDNNITPSSEMDLDVTTEQEVGLTSTTPRTGADTQELLDSHKTLPEGTPFENTAMSSPRTLSLVETSFALPENNSDIVMTTEGYTMYYNKADETLTENSTKNRTIPLKSSNMSTDDAISSEDEGGMITDNNETNTTGHHKNDMQFPSNVTTENTAQKENIMLFTKTVSTDNNTTGSSINLTAYDIPTTEGGSLSKINHTTSSVTTPPPDMFYQTSTPSLAIHGREQSQNMTGNGTTVETKKTDMSSQTNPSSVLIKDGEKNQNTTENETMSFSMSYQTTTPSVTIGDSAEGHNRTENVTTVEAISSDILNKNSSSRGIINNITNSQNSTENGTKTEYDQTPPIFTTDINLTTTTINNMPDSNATGTPESNHTTSFETTSVNDLMSDSNGTDTTEINRTTHFETTSVSNMSQFTGNGTAESNYTTRIETTSFETTSVSNMSQFTGNATAESNYTTRIETTSVSNMSVFNGTGPAENNHTAYFETTTVSNISESNATGTPESNHTTSFETTSVNDLTSESNGTDTTESNHTSFFETTSVNNMSQFTGNGTAESNYTTRIETTSVSNMSLFNGTGPAEFNHTAYFETTTVSNMSESNATGTTESNHTTYFETTTVNNMPDSNATDTTKSNYTTYFETTIVANKSESNANGSAESNHTTYFVTTSIDDLTSDSNGNDTAESNHTTSFETTSVNDLTSDSNGTDTTESNRTSFFETTSVNNMSQFTGNGTAESNYTTRIETTSVSNMSVFNGTGPAEINHTAYFETTTVSNMSVSNATGTTESNHTTYFETTTVNNMPDSNATDTTKSNYTTYFETTILTNKPESNANGSAESNHTTYFETTSIDDLTSDSNGTGTAESHFSTYIETTTMKDMPEYNATGTTGRNYTTCIETTSVNNMSEFYGTGSAKSDYTTFIETTYVNDMSSTIQSSTQIPTSKKTTKTNIPGLPVTTETSSFHPLASSQMDFTSRLQQSSTNGFDYTTQQWPDTTPSLPNVQTTTELLQLGVNFRVIPIEAKPTSVKFFVEGSLPEGKECKWIKIKYNDADSVQTTQRKCLYEKHFNVTFVLKSLEIPGACYPLEIYVTTTTGDKIGPRMYDACTLPKRPHAASGIQSRTTTSLTLQIVHPKAGQFDSFEIDYKMNGNHHKIVIKRSQGNITIVELSPLVPGSCYDIKVFTVSNGQPSVKPRDITKQCLLPSSPGQNHTVVFNQSSFTLSWLKPDGYVAGYFIDLDCPLSAIGHPYHETIPSVQVTNITHGDCCKVNITAYSNRLNSTTQVYYIHVNDSVPEEVIVDPPIASKQKVQIVWSPPVHSNGWLLGYNIQLYDNATRNISTFSIECDQPEISCHEKFYQKRFQCMKYVLKGNRSEVNFNDYGTSLKLTISNLQPGSSYFYNISAYNKIGTSSSKLIPVKTPTDRPSAPADMNVTVLNTTSIEITWLPPKTPNGVITKYKVTYQTYIGPHSVIEVDGHIKSVLLTDLDCWETYKICVNAKTNKGYGLSICDNGITDVYEPLSQIRNVVEYGLSLKLEFETPCEGLSIDITYNISYISLNHTCNEDRLNNITTHQMCYYGDPCEITGLHNYWDYHIQVQETVNNKIGPWSKIYSAKTLPGSPGEVRSLNINNITSNSLTVCWDKPCFLNGPLDGYEVMVAGRPRSDLVNVTCSVVTSLSPYTMYNVSVVTVSNYGRSPPSYVSGKTDVAKPAKPGNVKLIIEATKIGVAWSTINPYPGPTNYTVNIKDRVTTHSCKTSSFNNTYCIVNGLEEFWKYRVTVTAHTSKGSNTSEEYQTITHEAAPGPVTHFNVEPEKNPENPRQIYVRFNSPEEKDKNGQLKAYYIRCMSAQSKKIIKELKLNGPTSEIKIIMPEQHLLNISVFAETIANGTEVFKTVIVPEGDKDFPIHEAVAGITSAILVFIILALILFIFYKKKTLFFKPRPETKDNIQLNSVNRPKKKISETEDKRKNRPIKTDRFYQHVEILARDSNHFFSKEYKELKAMAPVHSTEAAEQQEARTKNRYSNILPWDHSRVKLLPLDDEEGSDFINANYIPGYNSKREYIATQGPLPSTKDDFWRMIWEQNVTVIVMLTQCVERGKRKCECYWPECVKEPVYYGDISIEIENESHLPEYVLRTINITLGAKHRKVKHVHFLKWPDFGCPDTTWLLIDFVRSVQVFTPHHNPGPIVVHCSAGVGRTGTFIAVDVLLHQLDNDTDQIDIFGDVLQLRNHRCNMVQTEDQYIFIHHCISDYIEALIEDSDEEAIDGGDEPMYQNVPRR